MKKLIAMRHLLFAALSIFAGTASAQDQWVESSVTLALTLSRSGAEQIKPGESGTATRTVPLQDSRLGNREIIENLQSKGYIAEVEGWRLVAIWADWPDTDPYVGNSYRFYVRRGTRAATETVAVPSSILSINPLHAEVGVKQIVLVEEESILSGSETLRILSEIRFAAAGVSGDPQGIRAGTGRYVRVSGQTEGRYVPGASKARVAGEFLTDDETRAGLVSGSIGFAPGKFVAAAHYGTPVGTSTGITMEATTLQLYDMGFEPIFASGVYGRVNFINVSYNGGDMGGGEDFSSSGSSIQIGPIGAPSFTPVLLDIDLTGNLIPATPAGTLILNSP